MDDLGNQKTSNNNFNLNEYSSEELLRSALKFHVEGNISEASSLYQHYLERGFLDPRALSNFGLIQQQLGNYNQAIKLFQSSIDLFPSDANAFNHLATIFFVERKFNEAERLARCAIKINSNFADAHNNLGNILSELKLFSEAELSFKCAIKLKPNIPLFYSNLGNLFIKVDKFEDAETFLREAIKLDSNMAQAYSNLSIVLQRKSQLSEAESLTRIAIKLSPLLYEAHNNLGNILRDLGKLSEAEVSFRNAVRINPDFAIGYSNLGITLIEKDDLEDADRYLQKAIILNPESEEVNRHLSILYYIQGRNSEACDLITKATRINSKYKINNLLLKIFKNNKFIKKKTNNFPIILTRKIEDNLVNKLYSLKSLDLNEVRDPTFGNARGSDYCLFDEDSNFLRGLEADLLNIASSALTSDIFIVDSFFTILKSGGVVEKHNHIGNLDKIKNLNLAKRKYSLVYYVIVGNQDCKEPGFLQFYSPDQKYLPYQGMIIIFPAHRYHSVKYNGNSDRIIVGINFYIN